MTMDLSRLIDEFYGYFLGLYHHSKPQAAGLPAPSPADQTTGQPFLAFAGFGTPITPDMFTLKSGELFEGLVVEQFSILANQIPKIQDTSIVAPGLLSVDGLFGALLDQAQPLTPADMEGLGAMKRHAQEMFVNTLPGLTPGTGDFHPALPTPPDWPLPSGAAAWTSRTFEQSETVSAGPPPAPPPRLLPVWRWRVAPDAVADNLHNVDVIRVMPLHTPMPPGALAAHPVAMHLAMAAPLMATSTVTLNPVVKAAAAAYVPPPKPAVATGIMRTDAMALQMHTLAQQSAPQAVTSKSIKLSFDYCMVQANRPWLSPAFLTARNWYVPRTKAGEIASGNGSGTGEFEVVPTAALVAKNLVIEADWSRDESLAFDKFVNFGPFSLVGRTVSATKNSIQCLGMQIIGWVFEPMPRLPPNSDPALS
jgi:hypothetical protein